MTQNNSVALTFHSFMLFEQSYTFRISIFLKGKELLFPAPIVIHMIVAFCCDISVKNQQRMPSDWQRIELASAIGLMATIA